MLASVSAATVLGVSGHPVLVEVHVALGLPCFTVVGLPDASCREARERVRAAILSSGLPWPQHRITVNLAPANVRKEGSAFDLAIAVGILVASGQLSVESVRGLGFIGELGLDGSVRRCRGVIGLAEAIAEPTLVVPAADVPDAALVHARVRGVHRLVDVFDALSGTAPWPDIGPVPSSAERSAPPVPDLRDVRAQPFARRALEIAAAGGHHLLLTGPPGVGKTMLARRLPGLLPRLPREEAIEVLRVASAAGIALPLEIPMVVPFRSPHHTASQVSVIGGGTSAMRPGELSCAHRGVLFLDELGEFAPSVIDSLRQPLEEGVVRVARARASITFPASFLLVGASNPCPCGWLGGAPGEPTCRCSPAARERYSRRLSGPVLDRFDLRITVERPPVDQLLGGAEEESTSVVAERVHGARQIARSRGWPCTADIPAGQLDRWASLDPDAHRLLTHHLRVGTLTARGLARVRRVARTIADLDALAPDVPLDDERISMALELRRPAPFETVHA